MEKSLFERFIGKYNLGGSVQSVILKAQDGVGLSTRFMTDDKNVLGTIQSTKLEVEEGDYGVYDTAQLRSLLSVLDEEIKLRVVKKDSKPTGFALSDDETKVTYVLADQSNIPAVPSNLKLPDFEVIIKLNEHFVNTFIKAKGALPEVETFTVVTDGKKTEVIVGYSESLNTNRVALGVETEVAESIDPISFNAKYFREILLANKEMTDGKLKIASKGMAHASFTIDGFEVNYYLVKKERQD